MKLKTGNPKREVTRNSILQSIEEEEKGIYVAEEERKSGSNQPNTPKRPLRGDSDLVGGDESLDNYLNKNISSKGAVVRNFMSPRSNIISVKPQGTQIQ